MEFGQGYLVKKLMGFPQIEISQLMYSCIYYKKLKINTMKHRYNRNKYPARNLSHSFIIVILKTLGIPARAQDFQFVTSVPENTISGVLGHLSNSNHWYY